MIARSSRLEVMDTLECSEEELAGALAFLKNTNRFFGGRGVILRHLEKFSAGWESGKTVRILDAGCGLGDIAAGIASWARRGGFSVRITGAERSPLIARLARKHTAGLAAVEIVEEEVFSNSWPPQSFDYVIASLFLHHVPPGREAEALTVLDRLARRGLILSDLERGHFGLLGVSSLSYIMGNRVVRHDGPLSVRRSLTLLELSRLAQAAKLLYLKAKREAFFRLSLAGEK